MVTVAATVNEPLLGIGVMDGVPVVTVGRSPGLGV
jgi:hypothetical protein